MARATSWIAGALLFVVALGWPLSVLESAPVTRHLVRTYSQSEQAGLSRAQAEETAEQVRAFVVNGRGSLPRRVAGREGFDADAISHLVDVRDVMRGAGIAVGVSAALLAAWLVWAAARHRRDAVAAALRAGGTLSAGLVVAAGLVALFDFAAFFSAFHGLFFDAGTWTFPYDSLLIQLFPERFWATLGLWWGALVGATAVAYLASSVAVRGKAFAKKA